jgi:hypothetical protein
MRIRELSFPRGFFPNIQRLNINVFHELVEVGAFPTTPISLHLQECSSLEEIRGLFGLEKLRPLDISGCIEIEELRDFETLRSLEELRGIFVFEKFKKRIRNLDHATIFTNKKVILIKTTNIKNSYNLGFFCDLKFEECRKTSKCFQFHSIFHFGSFKLKLCFLLSLLEISITTLVELTLITLKIHL